LETNNIISIIIPCYNQAEYLEEAVQSVLDQTYTNIEIIIVNDGSTDNSQEIAEALQKEYPEKIKIISQQNQGLSVARNTGIKESTGNYILPLDADDILDSHMLEKTVEVLYNEDIDIVSPDGLTFGEKEYKIVPKDSSLCNLLYANCLIICSLYKREVWLRTGGYKQNMHGGYEDWEFWINAVKYGFKFKRYPEILFHYRVKTTSMYISAKEKDRYLKAKIMLNHPELYTLIQVQEAIAEVREMEQLPSLYFYSKNGFVFDMKKLEQTLLNYLTSNELLDDQLISIPGTDEKIRLYSLNAVENETHLNQLYDNTDVKFIIFYSQLRYEIPLFQTLDFSWDKDKGIQKIYGTVFPFVFKDVRENGKLQLIAHQRELKYWEAKYHKDIENETRKMKNLQNSHVHTPIRTKPFQKLLKYKSLKQVYTRLKRLYNEYK